VICPNYKFIVIDNTPLGKACVATSDIKEGEIICKMNGTSISYKQFCEKFGNDCDDLLQIENENYIELMEPYIYFNHSCNPNAGIRNKGILFALKDIKKNEEICYDYSSTSDDLCWKMQCKCGEANCRKTIRDFQNLPHELKEFYKGKGALMDYLVETYY
jgi:hypothetical protein